MAEMMRGMGGMKGRGRCGGMRESRWQRWPGNRENHAKKRPGLGLAELIEANGEGSPRCKPANAAGFAGLCGSVQRRNAQHLAGVDFVGVRQHGLVGLENHSVLGALALAVAGLDRKSTRLNSSH